MYIIQTSFCCKGYFEGAFENKAKDCSRTQKAYNKAVLVSVRVQELLLLRCKLVLEGIIVLYFVQL